MISVDLGFTEETDPDKVEAAAHDALASLKIFDFTQPLEEMNAQTLSVYYRLRRVALTAQTSEFAADKGKGDASLLPDGRIYTEQQVIEILGPDYSQGMVIPKGCCG